MHVELAGRILQRVGLSVGTVETNGVGLVELQPSNQLKVKLDSLIFIFYFIFFKLWPLFTYAYLHSGVGYCKLQICINSAVIQNGRRGRRR